MGREGRDVGVGSVLRMSCSSLYGKRKEGSGGRDYVKDVQLVWKEKGGMWEWGVC